jgi:hypothetical protein
MPIGELMAEFHDRPHATPKPATAGPVFLGIRVYARVVADAPRNEANPSPLSLGQGSRQNGGEGGIRTLGGR